MEMLYKGRTITITGNENDGYNAIISYAHYPPHETCRFDTRDEALGEAFRFVHAYTGEDPWNASSK
tara:strand:+ start:634 stop:831 length:198 start_codon:yes stop_codon:yes gene_type:complete